MIYKITFGMERTWVTAEEAAQIIASIEQGAQSLFVRGRYIADARKVVLTPDPEARKMDLPDADPRLIKALKELDCPLVEGMEIEEPKRPRIAPPYSEDNHEIEHISQKLDPSIYKPECLKPAEIKQ